MLCLSCVYDTNLNMLIKRIFGNLKRQRKKKDKEIAQSLRESLNKYFSKQTDCSLENVAEDWPPNENHINENENENDVNETENENDTNECENANDLNIYDPKVWDNLDAKMKDLFLENGHVRETIFKFPLNERSRNFSSN